MSLHAVASGFSGLSTLREEGGPEDPSWVRPGEVGIRSSGPKPSLSLTFRDLFDEVRRRLALKGHPWE